MPLSLLDHNDTEPAPPAHPLEASPSDVPFRDWRRIWGARDILQIEHQVLRKEPAQGLWRPVAALHLE